MFVDIGNIKSNKSDIRKFGITAGIILMIIAGVLFWKEIDLFNIFLASGIILFLIAIALPSVFKPIYWIWMSFAIILGWFMTRVIISLLFFLIISPIGLFLRLFGKQFIELQWDKTKDSYWNFRTQENLQNESYEKQF